MRQVLPYVVLKQFQVLSYNSLGSHNPEPAIDPSRRTNA